MFKKLLSFKRKIADLPDKPTTQMSAADVKAYFDSAPDEVRLALNTLIDALHSIENDDSGAKYIGLTPFDGSPKNVQDALAWLKEQINQMTLGQIPDRSISEQKLSLAAITQLDSLIRSNSTKPLTMEVRTSDPPNPIIGQMWLRRDL
jgi:hypothetical protein